MKRVIAGLLIAILACGFTGCGSAVVSSFSSDSSTSSESSSEVSEVFDPSKVTLAVCMGSIDHPIYRVVQLGFIENARKLGYTNIMISGLPYDYPAQTWSMNDLLEQWKVDVFESKAAGVLVWASDDSCYELMQKWHGQGIKIVVPFFAHSCNDTHEFIDANPANDEISMGTTAADFIVSELEARGVTSGGIGITQHGLGVTSNYPNDAFRKRIAELGTSFTVLDTIFVGVELEWSRGNIEKYITENPNIVAAFGITGGCAQYWDAAKEALGRQDIVVVATDYTTQNLQVLEDGGVAALIGESIYDSGVKSAEMLDAVLRGNIFDETQWQPMMKSTLITANGEGINGIDYYLDLYQRSSSIVTGINSF